MQVSITRLVLLIGFAALGLCAQTPPAPAAPADTSETSPAARAEQLKELLERYRANQITAIEYHQERARLMQPPGGFPQRPSEPAPEETPAQAPAAPEAVEPAISPARAMQAALVPDADLVLRVDLAAMRQAPAYELLQAAEKQQTQELQVQTPLSPAAAQKLLQETLGLEEEDVQAVWLSADLDSIKLSGSAAAESMSALPLLSAIQLAKATTLDKLKSAIEQMAAAAAESGADDKTNGVQVTEDKIAATSVLRVTSQTGSQIPAWIALSGGQTIYLAPNRQSLAGALQRAATEPLELPPSIARVMESVPDGAQLKLAIRLPYSFRKQLADFGQNPQAGVAAMLAGFKDIQSVSLGLTMDEGMAVDMAADLGSAQAANSVTLLVNTLRPQFKAGLAEQIGRPPAELADDLLTAAAKGSAVNVRLRLPRELLATTQPTAPQPE